MASSSEALAKNLDDDVINRWPLRVCCYGRHALDLGEADDNRVDHREIPIAVFRPQVPSPVRHLIIDRMRGEPERIEGGRCLLGDPSTRRMNEGFGASQIEDRNAAFRYASRDGLMVEAVCGIQHGDRDVGIDHNHRSPASSRLSLNE